MKKRTVSNLSLNKRNISSFKTVITGGLPPKSHFEKDCSTPVRDTDECPPSSIAHTECNHGSNFHAGCNSNIGLC